MVQISKSQDRTITNLSVIFCALLGESASIDIRQSSKTENKNRVSASVTLCLESDSSTLTAVVLCEGCIESIALSVDGRPAKVSPEITKAIEALTKAKMPLKNTRKVS